MSAIPWPSELIAVMRDLAAQGASAGVIGKAINKTRNAVIGKARRLGMPLYGLVTKDGRAKCKPSDRIRLEPEPEPEPEVIPEPPFEARNIPMIERLEFTQCPFPMWAHDAASGGPDFIVCGCTKGLAKPYCEHHMKITHQPVVKRKQRIALREGFLHNTNAAFNFLEV